MSKDMARRAQPTVFKFLSPHVFNTYEGARTMNCEDRYQHTNERFSSRFQVPQFQMTPPGLPACRSIPKGYLDPDLYWHRKGMMLPITHETLFSTPQITNVCRKAFSPLSSICEGTFSFGLVASSAQIRLRFVLLRCAPNRTVLPKTFPLVLSPWPYIILEQGWDHADAIFIRRLPDYRD